MIFEYLVIMMDELFLFIGMYLFLLLGLKGIGIGFDKMGNWRINFGEKWREGDKVCALFWRVNVDECVCG